MKGNDMKGINLLQALENIQEMQTHMDPAMFLLAVVSALVSALLAMGLYRFFYESRATGSQVHRAFPLLAIAMTMIFITVQMSVTLSLGLIGSLSIIRFRTPIKEPEEIGFIMLVIAASIGAATFNFRFIVILFVVASFALAVIRGSRTWHFFRRAGVMVFTLPDAMAEDGYRQAAGYLKQHIRRSRLESSSSHDGVTSIQMSFSGLKQDVVELQQGLRRSAPLKDINVFLDRPGGIR